MTRKAQYIAGDHLTDVTTCMTYSIVVSPDTVRIGFLMVALNNLVVLAGDIHNDFLEDPAKKKILCRFTWNPLGPTILILARV